MIYSVNAYTYAKKVGNGWNCNTVSLDKAIQLLKDGKDNGLNLRLQDDKDCFVFGDIDHCPNEDTANNIFQMICEEFKVNDNQISKSFCYKEDVKEYSYHWSIPTFKSKTLKHVFNQEKYKEFKNMVDTSPYKNSWFRLPYQTTKEKKLTHKIIQGNPEDFFVQHIPDDTTLFHYEIKEENITKKNITMTISENKQVNNVMKNEDYEENDIKIKKLLEFHLLDKKANGSWDDWAEVGMAMKQSNPDGLDNFTTFSKINKEKYNDDMTITFWNGIIVKNDNEDKLSIGSLMMWAKECNQEEYYKIQDYGISKIFNDYTDEGLGQIVVNEMGQDLIYQDSELYVYYNDSWIKNNDVLCKSLFTDCLRNVFNTILSILTKEKIKTADEDQQEKIEKQMKGILNALKEIKKIKTKNNVFQAVIITLSKRLDKIEFDNIPHLLGFDNGVFNLQTKQFEPKNKNYYITMTTGYDYIEDEDEEGIKNISDFYDTVFPIKEEKDLYAILMMRSFFGKNLDKFIIANGGGGNGKSVIHNLNKNVKVVMLMFFLLWC